VIATLLVLVSCAPRAPHPPAVAPRATPLRVGPLTDFVAAPGLRWMATARLQELWQTPAIRPSLELLFPAARLDAFSVATGVDLRETPAAIAAGFEYATLFLAETPRGNAPVEDLFVGRLAGSARAESAHPGVRRVSGALGLTPETLVRVDGKLVAVSVGDPTPARVVELFALGRLVRTRPALAGSALSTLPPELRAAPACFYAPGPFSGEWAKGARGLLGAALALGVGAWPDGETLRLRVVLSGQWSGEDVARLESAWGDLAGSSMGRLLGLAEPATPPEISVTPEHLTLGVRLHPRPLASGLRAAVAADLWEILEQPAPGGRGPPSGAGRGEKSVPEAAQGGNHAP
jgi:hypothetical protein